MKILILALLFAVIQASAKNTVFKYDTAAVNISGILDLQTFPGLPNYESIERGDEPERYFYLKLKDPIDVIASRYAKGLNVETVRNVRIIQLTIDGEDEKIWSKLRAKGKGANITISGTFFHSFTGHHHARVLLDVKNVTL